MAEDNADFRQHMALCAKSRRRRVKDPVWRGRAEEEGAFGKRREISGTRRGVLIAGRVVGSYGEQRDRTVSEKLE